MLTKPLDSKRWCTALVLVLLVSGCGRHQVTASGGTSGSIHVGNKYVLPDVQVNVYLLEGSSPRWLGMGVSGLDGKFQLFTADGKAPLWLSPSQYTFTLESVGPNTLVWKEPVKQPNETPLRKSWTASDTTLDLDVPEPRVRTH